MSQSIIDMFKIIQVKIKQCPLSQIILSLIYVLGKIPLTAHAVIDSCKEIRVCLLLCFLVKNLFVCNII